MTILYSCYVPQGIIFAADTMVTQRSGARFSFLDSSQPKVFAVPGLGVHPNGGLVGYFGNAMVGAAPMWQWLPNVIGAFAHSVNTATFPAFLLQQLQSDARQRQLRSIQGFHIGAFERRSGHRVPVFWFLRNAEIDQTTGRYLPFPSWTFRYDEQLLGRDYAVLLPRDVRDNIRTHVKVYGTPVWYCNGDLGVAAAAGLGVDVAAQAMMRFQSPGYRMPSSLERWRKLAGTYVSTASSLAQVYFRAGTPTIGGRVISLTVPWD